MGHFLAPDRPCPTPAVCLCPMTNATELQQAEATVASASFDISLNDGIPVVVFRLKAVDGPREYEVTSIWEGDDAILGHARDLAGLFPGSPAGDPIAFTDPEGEEHVVPSQSSQFLEVNKLVGRRICFRFKSHINTINPGEQRLIDPTTLQFAVASLN